MVPLRSLHRIPAAVTLSMQLAYSFSNLSDVLYDYVLGNYVKLISCSYSTLFLQSTTDIGNAATQSGSLGVSLMGKEGLISSQL